MIDLEKEASALAEYLKGSKAFKLTGSKELEFIQRTLDRIADESWNEAISAAMKESKFTPYDNCTYKIEALRRPTGESKP